MMSYHKGKAEDKYTMIIIERVGIIMKVLVSFLVLLSLFASLYATTLSLLLSLYVLLINATFCLLASRYILHISLCLILHSVHRFCLLQHLLVLNLLKKNLKVTLLA